VDRILDQLHRAFEGDAWHGTPVKELLRDLPAKKAAARPIAAGHSIWELVLHMIAWQRVVVRRLAGEALLKLPADENWPAIPDTSEDAWVRAREDLTLSHRQLHDTIARLADSWLCETVPGKDYSVYVMLHGVIQHNLYHAGQIALLKKA
jgi:uncharacterized damage-inducible protein DinB